MGFGEHLSRVFGFWCLHWKSQGGRPRCPLTLSPLQFTSLSTPLRARQPQAFSQALTGPRRSGFLFLDPSRTALEASYSSSWKESQNPGERYCWLARLGLWVTPGAESGEGSGGFPREVLSAGVGRGCIWCRLLLGSPCPPLKNGIHNRLSSPCCCQDRMQMCSP